MIENKFISYTNRLNKRGIFQLIFDDEILEGCADTVGRRYEQS